MRDLFVTIKQFIQHNKIMVALITGFIVLVVLSALSIWSQTRPDQTEGNNATESSTEDSSWLTISITNFDDYAKNLPNSERAAIENMLARTIQTNLNDQPLPTAGAVIRHGSYSQTIFNAEKEISLTVFIVDISEIQQSYRVEHYYSPLPAEETRLFDYTTLVLCPTADELIYDAFECTDRIKQEQAN